MLRHWLAGDGLPTAGERAGVDRKTAPRTWRWVRRRGLRRDGGDRQLCDELIGAVVAAVRPAGSWVMGRRGRRCCRSRRRSPTGSAGLVLTNIHGKLTRRGVLMPYRTLHRFAAERRGFGRRQPTGRSATSSAA